MTHFSPTSGIPPTSGLGLPFNFRIFSVLEITADVSARCPTDLTHWLDYCETYLKEDSECGYGKWYHGNYTIQPPKCVHT